MHEAPDKIEILSKVENFNFVYKWFELAQEKHFWIKGRFEIFLRRVQCSGLDIRNPLLGLEVGCGNGVLSDQIEKHTPWTMDRTDLDLKGLRFNKKGRGQIFLYNILEKREQFKGYYDFIVLFDVLEHIENTQEFLESCLFHLKRGGHIFINVPALPALMSVYDTNQGHLRRYKIKTLSRELTAARLEILSCHYWGLFMVPVLYLRKLLISKKTDSQEIMQKGFEPPNAVIHGVFKFLMKAEQLLFTIPFSGTSVMAISKKPEV